MKASMKAAFAALMFLTAPVMAHAAVPIIDWDPAYVWQVGATPTNMPLGGEMKVVGTVSMFGPPLQDLNAGDPTTEFTFYIHGLTSLGTTSVGPPATTFYTTNYAGGQIELYFDTSPDASFAPNPPNAAVPSTFTDGTVLLTGVFTRMVVYTNNFTAFKTGNMEGDITWTGGTLFNRFSPGGQPCPGLFIGGITWSTAPNLSGRSSGSGTR